MRQLPNDTVRQLIESADTEKRNLEFKPPFTWDGSAGSDSWLKECVIRAILAFTNTPHGGTIIVGVSEEETQKKPILTGLTEVQRISFNDYERIKGCVDGFSTTPIQFEILWGVHTDGNTETPLVFITVSTFSRLPAICKKNGSTDKLRRGCVYARSAKGAPASDTVTEIEMTEIIEMAADLEIEQLNNRGHIQSIKDHQSAQDDVQVEKFDNQISDLGII